jgi:magnesium transporter
MLAVYLRRDNRFERIDDPEAIPAEAIWIDMLRPTGEEEKLVEAALGIGVPTQDEMREIEASSRLYQEDGCLFMTATVLSRTDTTLPESQPITFVLTADRLVTVRYSEPRSFEMFAARICRAGGAEPGPEATLVGLLDTMVDRTADVIERLAGEMDALSATVFQESAGRRRRTIEFQDVLHAIGRKGDLNSKIRESLFTIARLTAYLGQALFAAKADRELRGRVKTLGRDVASLTDHSHFLSNNITFLLDATLGMINIEQSAIIKIVSVAAVVFLPPTVIASIYGMNFEIMPELGWSFGYPFALALMVASAILPYLIFRRLGWL